MGSVLISGAEPSIPIEREKMQNTSYNEEKQEQKELATEQKSEEEVRVIYDRWKTVSLADLRSMLPTFVLEELDILEKNGTIIDSTCDRP